MNLHRHLIGGVLATSAGVNVPPITYQVNGEQYIAVAAGGNFQMTFPYGDTVAIFKLPSAVAASTKTTPTR